MEKMPEEKIQFWNITEVSRSYGVATCFTLWFTYSYGLLLLQGKIQGGHIEYNSIVKIPKLSIDSGLTDPIRQIKNSSVTNRIRVNEETRKVNSHARTLVVAVTLLMAMNLALFTAVNPVSAEKGTE